MNIGKDMLCLYTRGVLGLFFTPENVSGGVGNRGVLWVFQGWEMEDGLGKSSLGWLIAAVCMVIHESFKNEKMAGGLASQCLEPVEQHITLGRL